jgi:hypothetical protein
VAVAAPGIGILSTVRGGSYQSWSGTSMAGPHVAGLAGLVIAQNPARSNAQVRQVIQQSADDLGTPGRDDYFGYGRVNAERALGGVVGPTPTITNPTQTPLPGRTATPIPSATSRISLTPTPPPPLTITPGPPTLTKTPGPPPTSTRWYWPTMTPQPGSALVIYAIPGTNAEWWRLWAWYALKETAIDRIENRVTIYRLTEAKREALLSVCEAWGLRCEVVP